MGKPEGLHFLYVRYAPDVIRYVDSLVHDHHEAEDITQNVFAKLATEINRYEQRDIPFTAWIRRVARNAALDYIRAGRAAPLRRLGSPTRACQRSALSGARPCCGNAALPRLG